MDGGMEGWMDGWVGRRAETKTGRKVYKWELSMKSRQVTELQSYYCPSGRLREAGGCVMDILVSIISEIS
jgi:hypothetical protein